MAASDKDWRGGGSEFRHKDAPMCCTLAPVTALPTPGGIMEKWQHSHDSTRQVHCSLPHITTLHMLIQGLLFISPSRVKHS